MDDIDSRIKEHIKEHLKFDIDVNKDGFKFRAYLKYSDKKKETESTIYAQDVVFDNLLDEDTADNRYATKEYVEDNFQYKE